MNNCEGASLWDLMEINEEMVLSMVKEQLNHYIIIKGKWWRMQKPASKVESSWLIFFVFFVAQQILRIVGSQIEAEKVFSIISICTNMQHS
jgi:hypothetical protein